jgi:hypothetical protein
MSTWQADTAASVAAIRASLGTPTLHLTVIELPASYNPAPPITNLGAARAAQESMVAADAHASIVGGSLNVTTVTSNIHLSQYDLDRQAQLVATDIRSRVIL